mmetsp:Transcript_64390/g.102133  ORF Transcript_64390/g.102133 Transcript_64390/m.102133 type:complete len:92 (+) Transcript_64390:1022-1297(+)
MLKSMRLHACRNTWMNYAALSRKSLEVKGDGGLITENSLHPPQREVPMQYCLCFERLLDFLIYCRFCFVGLQREDTKVCERNSSSKRTQLE